MGLTKFSEFMKSTITHPFFVIFCPSDIILTNSKYFLWISHLIDLLCRELHQLTLGTKKSPLNALKKYKWGDKNDKSHRLSTMCVSSGI